MADDKKKKPEDKKTKKKAAKGGAILFIILFGFAAPFLMPTLLVILAGLVPTYVALITDDDQQKSSSISVSAMNIAGLVPFIIDLWRKGQTMQNAMQIITSVDSWVIILGAAGIGQLIVYAVPQAIASLTLTTTEARLKHLNRNLEMLKESWGPDVSSTKSISQLRPE